MKAIALLGLAVLVACGDSVDGAGDGGDSNGGGATITLAGAVNATLPALAVASKSDSDSFSTVGVSIVRPQGSVTSASLSFRLTGVPAKGSYTSASASVEVSALEVSTSDNKSWAAFKTPPSGTVGTLEITSVSMMTKIGAQTLYTIHGSLALSTLTNTQGTSSVTMTASF